MEAKEPMIGYRRLEIVVCLLYVDITIQEEIQMEKIMVETTSMIDITMISAFFWKFVDYSIIL